MKLLILSLAVTGLTLVVAFGALAFEGGIIADASGGIGATTPVQFGMLALGGAAILVAVILLMVAKVRSRRE